jgi:hypothetical protein
VSTSLARAQLVNLASIHAGTTKQLLLLSLTYQTSCYYVWDSGSTLLNVVPLNARPYTMSSTLRSCVWVFVHLPCLSDSKNSLFFLRGYDSQLGEWLSVWVSYEVWLLGMYGVCHLFEQVQSIAFITVMFRIQSGPSGKSITRMFILNRRKL